MEENNKNTEQKNNTNRKPENRRDANKSQNPNKNQNFSKNRNNYKGKNGRRHYSPNKNHQSKPKNKPKEQAPDIKEEKIAETAQEELVFPEEKPVTPRFDYEDNLPSKPDEPKDVEVVGVRFRGGSKVYYFSPSGILFEDGDHAIVETVRGVEYGDVAAPNKFVGKSEVVQPLKPVLRKATEDDDRRNKENRILEEKAKPIWYEKVKKNGLEMQLVDVEYTHDNAKLCFYFTADGRVDFRELVKDLAGVFKTRIELRQIGVRDEAKLCGGIGVCGRPFCCSTFLPDFAQVSIKMAKEQNLSLSSAKISGACGRLMCCLRFEHETYEREYATFPKVDTIVETPKGRGVIIESSFLTGIIKVKMNSDQSVKTFTKNELKAVGTVKVRENVSEDLKKLEEK